MRFEISVVIQISNKRNISPMDKWIIKNWLLELSRLEPNAPPIVKITEVYKQDSELLGFSQIKYVPFTEDEIFRALITLTTRLKFDNETGFQVTYDNIEKTYFPNNNKITTHSQITLGNKIYDKLIVVELWDINKYSDLYPEVRD